MQVDDRLPYQQRALEKRLERAPRVVLPLVDTYVSGASFLAAQPTLPGVLDGIAGQLHASRELAGTGLAIASGGLAIAHGWAGFKALSEGPRSEDASARKLRLLQGWSDMVCAASLGAQAFGLLSPWCGAVAVVASITATTASMLRS